ncbi:mannose-1-phosphate guanylyltransferase [Henriciella sp.]|uniref:mannose-1-phosphate guanylyltransferase n=1 Tax=Henriciella sp. TaxID=1968823 RepID=UPI002604AAB4|nr:sugar phosphate nucleotidyltransferase [Henriciella sp.]
MNKHRIRPVILCGGRGTRLWPLSTPERPKQFLPLLGDGTMLETTLARVTGKSGDDALEFSDPLVIGSESHQTVIREGAGDAAVLLEPFGRNSAAPVAAAALCARPDDLLLVLPADHDIGDVPAFHEAIRKGADAALSGSVVTFGIVPDGPATGYGYIKVTARTGAVREAERFVEKPDRETAERYVSSGEYYWNAGIFLFRASDMRAAFREYAPDILDAVASALPADSYIPTGKTVRLEPEAFKTCREESVDYAIMEHYKNLKVVPVSMDWSDIGSFRALWERSRKDSSGNAVTGKAVLNNCRNCYVHVTGQSVSLDNLSDAVVIATPEQIRVSGMEALPPVRPL